MSNIFCPSGTNLTPIFTIRNFLTGYEQTRQVSPKLLTAKNGVCNEFCCLLGCENQHILLLHIQHVTHLWSGEDARFQFAISDHDFICNSFPDLDVTAALVVENLAFVWFIGAIVIHRARQRRR
jgi:hypothetical protein